MQVAVGGPGVGISQGVGPGALDFFNDPLAIVGRVGPKFVNALVNHRAARVFDLVRNGLQSVGLGPGNGLDFFAGPAAGDQFPAVGDPIVVEDGVIALAGICDPKLICIVGWVFDRDGSVGAIGDAVERATFRQDVAHAIEIDGVFVGAIGQDIH